MKKWQFPMAALALGMVFSANTCSESGTNGNLAMVPGKWELRTLGGQQVTLPAGVETPYLSIDSTGKNVTGFAGCNRMFGTMTISADSIAFPGLASTRMYCEATQQVENAFLDALNATHTYTLDGNMLTLKGGKYVAVLERVQ